MQVGGGARVGRGGKGASRLGSWPARSVGGPDTLPLGPVGQRLVSGVPPVEQLPPSALTPSPGPYSAGPESLDRGMRRQPLGCRLGPKGRRGTACCRLILQPRGVPSLSPSPLLTTSFHFLLSIRRTVNDTINPELRKSHFCGFTAVLARWRAGAWAPPASSPQPLIYCEFQSSRV